MSWDDLAFEFHISSRVDLLEKTVKQIMKVARALPHAVGDMEDVDLALTEALANAIVHGNRKDASKLVYIGIGCESPGDLLLTITDEGDGFAHERIPDPTEGANVYSGHGRGLLLIKHLMDSVEFSMGGRCLIMRKRARKEAATVSLGRISVPEPGVAAVTPA
jgi:serine/threonine-protein kinase RsbW